MDIFKDISEEFTSHYLNFERELYGKVLGVTQRKKGNSIKERKKRKRKARVVKQSRRRNRK